MAAKTVAGVSGSGAATVSGLFKELGPQMLAHNWEVKFSVDLLYKDNLLGFQMGQEQGAPMPVAQVVHLMNEMARASGCCRPTRFRSAFGARSLRVSTSCSASTPEGALATDPGILRDVAVTLRHPGRPRTASIAPTH